MEIVKNIYQIPGVFANSYLIVEPEGLTLIDAGIPGSGKKILQYIDSLGRSPHDLKRILITHADMDHVGGVSALKKVTGAHVYAGAVESQAMSEGKSSRPIKGGGFSVRRLLMSAAGRLFRTQPTPADDLITDGWMLPVEGGLRAVETIGHTPGHFSYYLPALGVLFTGDSIVADDKGLQGSRPSFTWDAVKAGEAVKHQAALGARVVCPGHGPVVKDAAGRFPA
jgi:glyoxylase-like metal-dependent hydrolase (beta-lactamase superfamily II)